MIIVIAFFAFFVLFICLALFCFLSFLFTCSYSAFATHPGFSPFRLHLSLHGAWHTAGFNGLKHTARNWVF